MMRITSQDIFADASIVRTLGLAKGNVVRARFIGRDILAGLRIIAGGEVKEYTKLMAEAREQALDRMMANAAEMGADGVVCLRFTTSMIMQGAAEVLVTGTAVKLG
jgi:uncharacterized protein YbjQ (UPF0145 family)